MRRGRTEISASRGDARAAVFFFLLSPEKSPVKCAPKPQLRERKKNKKTAPLGNRLGKDLRDPRLRSLPAKNAREQNHVVQIRGPRSTFSRR